MTYRVALTLAFVFGSAMTGWAQVAAINGEIQGTITDPTGAVVPGATIKIVNSATGFAQTGATNTSGFYRFPVLPLGSYQLTATAAGFQQRQFDRVVLNAGAVITIDIPLSVSTQVGSVIVTDAAPAIDPSRTDLGYSLSSTQVSNLPLVSRNPFNFILIQPGVAGRPNTEFGVPRKINANGFDGRINYQVDGGNNTESDRAGIRLTPFSDTFIQEIQSVNNGFAPEFGNTVGTVFNAITKSGTNDLHGEGAYIFRRTDFSARPALLANNLPAPQVNVDDWFANVGGPIKKDKLFYFGGVEHVKRDLPQVVAVSSDVIGQLGLPATYANAIPFTQNVLFFLGRLDYQLNENNRFSLRFNGHRNDSPYNNGGGLVLLSQTYNFIDRSDAGSFQWISTISSQAVNELRVQVPYRLQRQAPFAATGTGPSITISGVAQFGGSPSLGFLYKEVTPEVADNFTYLLGNHSLKAGFSFRGVLDRQTQATAATYTFASVSDYLDAQSGVRPLSYTNFSQGLDQPSIIYNSHFYGGYIQDNWKLRPNVTLTYGARYDLYDPPAADKNSPYAPSRSFHTDTNNVAPRIGLAIGLGRDQKTILRGSAGIFYDPPATDVYRRALLQNGQVPPVTISTGPSAVYAPAYPNVFTTLPTGFNVPLQDIAAVSNDFANLYSINANFSVTRAITTSSGITATYLYTRGNRLPVYNNINLIPSGVFLPDGRAIFSKDHYDADFNNILLAQSAGQSIYNALNVMLNKRLSHGLELFASYTWSHAIDDAPEQNNIDSGALLPEDPLNRRRDRASSLTDRRHNFSASGVWAPAFPIGSSFLRYLVNNQQFSSLFVAYSGDVFNIGSNRVLNSDPAIPASAQRPLFIGRNTHIGPPTYQMDLRYTRLFPIRDRAQAQFFGEFTNLFNHTNVTGVNTTTRVDTLGNITSAPSFGWTSALDQRLIQLGVRLVF